MNIIPALQADETKLVMFFEQNDSLDSETLLKSGYVVEGDSEIEGCFALDLVEPDVYWLKQLYITKSAANKLPFLLEAILVMAKEKRAKSVYVHSHQPVVDILLDALQFNRQNNTSFVDNHPITKGNWWSYHVS
ncbi:hypothetical protein [Oceanobacillus chungangensis]|uniref:GNAT family N-acetyltransferase n=1 Tax=Oceanobacillus chungangensis TaxID=1229152 RepID=A0A3D8PWX9_9BACI|nr:hypothetical protein [Oceanobacillus chungangensis]RDW20534.1 hypothetical protein CWR45_04675 [Oceanobacillus chungangensis]